MGDHAKISTNVRRKNPSAHNCALTSSEATRVVVATASFWRQMDIRVTMLTNAHSEFLNANNSA